MASHRTRSGRDVEVILLGYLWVLGNQETLALLSPDEQEIGRTNVMGCLVDLEEFLEQDPALSSAMLLAAIKTREVVNGERPVGDFLLVQTTHYCAKAVYQYYKTAGKELRWD